MVTFDTDFWAPGMNSTSRRRPGSTSPGLCLNGHSQPFPSPSLYLDDDEEYSTDQLRKPKVPTVQVKCDSVNNSLAGGVAALNMKNCEKSIAGNGRPSGANVMDIPRSRPISPGQLPPHPPIVPMEGGVPPKRPKFLTRFLHADLPSRHSSPSSSPASPSNELGPILGHTEKKADVHAPVPQNVARKNHLREMLNRKSSFSGTSKKDWNGSRPSSPAASDDGLSKKYGVCERGQIGQGATAVVRLVHKLEHATNSEKYYAVKEFRKRRKDESEREYVKKLAAEFCISSTLHHVNVIETVDLVQDENHHWCEVMEYCPGGDLYNAIKSGCMTKNEINCCFKQLIIGVGYLHDMGVAHRDIKPENLLLDAKGHLKITDFGVSEVFRMCWEKNPHLSKPGVLGSEPYIAPEMFNSIAYDARDVDVWACGIVYYCMLYQGIPWRLASPKDPNYAIYLEQRAKEAYEPVQRLEEGCRNLLTRILEPNPGKRITIPEIVCDPWFRNIACCSADSEESLASRPSSATDSEDSPTSSSSSTLFPPNDLYHDRTKGTCSPVIPSVPPESHHHVPEEVLAAYLNRARRCQPTPP